MIRDVDVEFELRLVRLRPRATWPQENPFAENAVHAIVTARAHGLEGQAQRPLDGQWEDMDELAFAYVCETELEDLRVEALADLAAKVR